MADTLRNLLAKNLRTLVEREESIASFCRSLGINRQQFNNYLSGKNLPNETVIRQICKHFEIQPFELFVPEGYSEGVVVDQRYANFLGRIVKLQSDHEALPEPGPYFVYFEAPFDPTSLVRSFMEVRSRGPMRVFTRLTRIPMNTTRGRSTLWSRHDGFVRAERDDVHWSGYNARVAARPSLLVSRYVRTPPILYSGIGLIDTGNGTESVGFAITRAPERSISLMRSLGPVKTSETPATRVAIRAIEGFRSSFHRSYVSSNSQ